MNQFERSSRNFIFEYSNREIFEGMEKTFNEHVYAPRLEAFKQGWDSAKMVSRVGRVCKVGKWKVQHTFISNSLYIYIGVKFVFQGLQFQLELFPLRLKLSTTCSADWGRFVKIWAYLYGNKNSHQLSIF